MVLLRSFIPPRGLNLTKPSFELFKNGIVNGVDYLNPSLSINDITVTPNVRYKGGDATISGWAPWTYGASLSYTAGGGAITANNGSPLLGVNDDSVLFDTNAYFSAAESSTGDIATEDFVFEMVLKISANDYNIIGKRIAGAGYGIAIAGNQIRIVLHDGSGLTFQDTANLTPGSWYHFMAFGNRDESSSNSFQMYINGAASGGGQDISARLNITSSEDFVLGARSDGFLPYDSNIAYFAMWKQTSWHQAGASGPAEWATVAATRFAQLNGTYASTGTDKLPTFTRAGVADLTNEVDTFSVGANWPRVEPAGLLIASADSDSDLEYDFTGVTAGSLVCKGTLADEDTAADGVIAELHNGTANELIQLRVDAGSDSGEVEVVDGGISQATVTGTTDISDAAEHTISGSWTTNNVSLYIDKTSEGTPDTGATMPTTTKLSVGADRGAANHFEGHISSVKVYNKTNKKS